MGSVRWALGMGADETNIGAQRPPVVAAVRTPHRVSMAGSKKTSSRGSASDKDTAEAARAAATNDAVALRALLQRVCKFIDKFISLVVVNF